MPPVWNARRTSYPNPSSERAHIPNFRKRSIPNLWTRPMSSFWTYLFAACLCNTLPAANGVVRCAMGMPQRAGACSEAPANAYHWTGVSHPYLRYGDRGRLQNGSPPSVLFESSQNIFTVHWRHTLKKWWTRILKFKFCDFWEFFEIFKKASHGPSAADLDWTIMIAAKLDHSKVLVIKFHNGQRWRVEVSVRDTQTDRQTRLKIMALQVCNRAKKSCTGNSIHNEKKVCIFCNFSHCIEVNE